MSNLIITSDGWGKSSRSGNGGNCVEAKVTTAVRD